MGSAGPLPKCICALFAGSVRNCAFAQLWSSQLAGMRLLA